MASSLTDFLISALAVFFCWRLWISPAKSKELKHNFLGLFFAIGVGSLLGGIVHGFLPEASDKVVRLFWSLTLMSVGLAAYNLWLINFNLILNARMFSLLRNVARGLSFLYLLALLFVTQKYFIAIIAYIPPALLLFMVLLLRVLRGGEKFNFYGLIGMLLTFVAAYIQQAQIALHPIYFDHNALYHSVQALGLYGLYLYCCQVVKWKT